MKDLMKSLPWIRFAAMVLISLAFAWLIIHLTSYRWWFPIGIASYMLANLICFGLFGLDKPSLESLQAQRDYLRELLTNALLNEEYEEFEAIKAEINTVLEQITNLYGEGK